VVTLLLIIKLILSLTVRMV